MRVLKIFFTAILIFGVVGLIGGLIAREILLIMAVQQLRSDLRRLTSFPLAQNITQNCLEYSSSTDGSFIRYQLRFISDREYVLEGVCEVSESLRSVFETRSLPPLVRREVGQSGIIRGQDFHGVEVSVFGRVGAVYEEEGFFRSSYRSEQDNDITMNEGPATVCQGYGYECCDVTYQTGLDLQEPRALDCPRACYAGCTQRPVVLTFNADASSNQAENTRLAEIRSGDLVEFNYTVSDVKGDSFSGEKITGETAPRLRWDDTFLQILEKFALRRAPLDQVEKVVITFGDGASQDLTNLQGRATHTYTCITQPACVHTATIQAVTKKGITSNLEGLAQIQIRVTP